MASAILRPHLAAMRDNLATALGLAPGAVSVKARSNDGLGLEGEGAAASATAVARPMPDAAPVTNDTVPSSSPVATSGTVGRFLVRC